MNPQKRRWLSEVVGEDLADEVLAEAELATKELELKVAYKQREGLAERAHAARSPAAPYVDDLFGLLGGRMG